MTTPEPPAPPFFTEATDPDPPPPPPDPVLAAPGDYQTVHPYNLETRYEYKQGQLKHFEQRILLDKATGLGMQDTEDYEW